MAEQSLSPFLPPESQHPPGSADWKLLKSPAFNIWLLGSEAQCSANSILISQPIQDSKALLGRNVAVT